MMTGEGEFAGFFTNISYMLQIQFVAIGHIVKNFFSGLVSCFKILLEKVKSSY